MFFNLSKCWHRFKFMRLYQSSGPQPAKNFGGEDTFGNDYDVIDVQSTIIRLFCNDQLANIGEGIFFIVGGHGLPQGGKKWAFAPPANWHTNQIGYVWKTWSRQFNSDINGINSCNDSLFSGMALTLHKSQLHCFGITPWWVAYGSVMSAHLPAEADCETWERIALLLDFIV